MKQLNVLRSGTERGDYEFNSRLLRIYLRLKSAEIDDSGRSLVGDQEAAPDES